MSDSYVSTFKTGWIFWKTGLFNKNKLIEKYLAQEWDDGFVAFSSSEDRLEDFVSKWPDQASWLKNLGGIHNGKGYIMEAGFWRMQKGKKIHEELSIEREGDSFFVQYWRLHTTPSDADVEGHKCYFREAETFVRGNVKIFSSNKQLYSFEVVVPKARLHFYLTGRI